MQSDSEPDEIWAEGSRNYNEPRFAVSLLAIARVKVKTASALRWAVVGASRAMSHGELKAPTKRTSKEIMQWAYS
jgi:hypothetical protein